MKLTVDILSGAGRKTAAAILVQYQADNKTKPVRFLLDAGGALEAGEHKGWQQPKNLDAIFISHDHQDHMGGLVEVDNNVPVYATAAVQRNLPTHLNLKTLPLCGKTNVAGVEVTTGSAGHSFGGVWLHLNVGEGVFYSGDFSLESSLFPFSLPPKANIAMLDASYGLYNDSLDQCKTALLHYLNDDRSLLLPVPQTGRALEMACWLTSKGITDWTLADDCIKPETVLAGPAQGICEAMRPVLKKINSAPFDRNKKIILCGEPDGLGGEAAELLQYPEKYLPLYTGHLPEHARNAVTAGTAHFARWNVHPRSQDLKYLMDHLQCDICVPMFHNLKNINDWRAALGSSVTPQSYFELCYDTII